jgi:hypothetical protein
MDDKPSVEVCRKPLGHVLVEMGAIDEEQLEEILALQRHDGRRLGEIVVDRGVVTPLALVAALAQQRRGQWTVRRSVVDRPRSWTPLGQVLTQRRCISRTQLEQALADQRLSGGFLGEILLERGWITAAELVSALGEQLTHTDTPDRFYVREHVTGEIRTLHVAPSFVAATNYVFEHVLVDREPEQLEIVRGPNRDGEVVWCFAPVREKEPTVADLMNVFALLSRRAVTAA